MARRRGMWLVSLPLAAAGWLTAHWLACRLVAPAEGRHEDLHGYLVVAPIVLACGATVLLAGLALAVHDGFRGNARPCIPVLPVALLAPLGFAVQEHLERLIELRAIPFGTVLEPNFLVGIALQLPFAIVAVRAARAVSALGHALGRGLAVRRMPRRRRTSLLPHRPRRAPEIARSSLLATGCGERAPPSPATA